MSYSPSPAEPVPPMVGPFTYLWSPLATARALGTGAPGSAAWESNNRAVYFAIGVPTTCVVRRLWWANGATVSATYNVDVGVYADAGYKPGARLVSSGSTAQGTASQVQFVDVTDTTLAPGLYWLALACSTTAATLFRVTGHGAGADASSRFDEASALPLPATATPAESAIGYVYLCGFATTASP